MLVFLLHIIVPMLLSQFGLNSPLAIAIGQCVANNTTASAMWQCILASLAGANLQPGTDDHAVVEVAKTLAVYKGL